MMGLSVRCGALMLALTLLGCGGGPDDAPPTGTVSGRVTINDKPFTDGDVILYNASTGRGYNATPDEQGAFTVVEPVAVGEYVAYLAPKSAPAESNEPPKPVSMSKSAPEKYWSEGTSDIKVTVKEGENEIVVPMTGT